MPSYIIMPKNGMTMTEGVINKWFKQKGESIKEGEVIAEISTDKIALELESTVTGVVAELLYPEGSTVPVYENIALVAQPGEVISEAAVSEKKAAAEAEEVKSLEKADKITAGAVVKASPIAKRIAKEKGIDLAQITERTGPGGRIVEADVLKFIANQKQASVAPKAEAPCVEQAQAKGEEEIIPLVGIRKVIAGNVRQSVDTAVHVTSTTEIDMTELLQLNQKITPQWEKLYGVKPTINAYIIKATALALREHPILNSTVAEGKIILKKYYNIGLAMSIPEGIVIPVIKNADTLPVRQIAEQISAFAKKAKEGRLTAEDMSDGTFTITNVGPFKVQVFTPVIVQPQTAILGVGTTTERPAVVNGQIAIRSLANLCLTYDHRIIQGVPAAKFRLTIKELLEEPSSLLS